MMENPRFKVGQRVRCLDREAIGIDKQGAVTGRFADEGTVIDGSLYGRMFPAYTTLGAVDWLVYVRFDGMTDDEAWECREEQIELINDDE